MICTRSFIPSDVSDERAHSLLLLENEMSELTALEKGKHAYDHIAMVGKGKGGTDSEGKGIEGGVVLYAREHNLPNASVDVCYKAYHVYLEVSRSGNLPPDSVSILYEISKSPEEAWQTLCEVALEKEWTVKDAKDRVNRVKKLYAAIPEWWEVNRIPVVKNVIGNQTYAASVVNVFNESKEKQLSTLKQHQSATVCQNSDKRVHEIDTKKELAKIAGVGSRTMEKLCPTLDEPIDTKKELAKVAGVSHGTMGKVMKIEQAGTAEQREQKVSHAKLDEWFAKKYFNVGGFLYVQIERG